MALTIPKYETKFGVEVTNPVIIIASANIRKDHATVSQLVNGAYEQKVSDQGDIVHYSMMMFANKGAFDTRKEGMLIDDAGGINTWNFRLNDPDYNGMTVEQAIYHHFKTKVMPSETFSDAGISLNALVS